MNLKLLNFYSLGQTIFFCLIDGWCIYTVVPNKRGTLWYFHFPDELLAFIELVAPNFESFRLFNDQHRPFSPQIESFRFFNDQNKPFSPRHKARS